MCLVLQKVYILLHPLFLFTSQYITHRRLFYCGVHKKLFQLVVTGQTGYLRKYIFAKVLFGLLQFEHLCLLAYTKHIACAYVQWSTLHILHAVLDVPSVSYEHFA